MATNSDFEKPVFTNLTSAIRALAMDAVQKANSGHPGMPLGMAEIAEVLWNHHLRHNPADPAWPDRDRFVLSNGHGSMLLYALLHLTGYDLTIEDLKAFRQLHSKTPGHPEVGVTPGVETTTGPLGQGLANAVGMAIAELVLARTFNRPGHEIVDHRTWVFLGDGCLMEGISHEACSLAGTLGLGKLVCFYDDNGISIDGRVEGWFTDDTPEALRGLRLARRARRQRPRPRGDRRRDRGREGRDRAPDAHLLQDRDRHGRRDEGGHARRARRAARRRRDRRDAPAHQLAPPALRDPARRSTAAGTGGRAARGSRASGSGASTPTPRRTRTSPRSSGGASPASCPRAGRRTSRRRSRRSRRRPRRSRRARPRRTASRPTRRSCPS